MSEIPSLLFYWVRRLEQVFPTCGTRKGREGRPGGTRVTSIFSQKPGFPAF